ncbi:MAG: MFS transporter [Novosphingobium sp.]|nr:MFS transporter [Novosphingobium sp.]
MTAGQASDDGERPDRAVDGIIILSAMLTGLAMTGLVPVLPLIAREFAGSPGSDYLTKMVVSIVGLSVMVAAPFSVVATRRFTCRQILLVSFVGYAVCAAVSSMAFSLAFLIAVRFVQGVCVAVGVTTVLGILGHLYQGQARDLRLGLHMGFSAVGLFFLVPLAGYLGDIDWRLSPLLGGIVLVHLGLVLAAGRKLDIRLSQPAQSQVALEARDRAAAIRIGLLAFAIGVALYSPSAFLPFKAMAIGFDSASEISLVATVAVSTSAVASLGYARIRGFLGIRAVYLAGFSCGALGMACTGLASGHVLLFASSAVMGFGGGLLVTNVYADCAQRFFGDAQVRMTGIVKGTSFAGLFVGPLILQVLADATAPDAVFYALAAMLAGLFALMLRPDSMAQEAAEGG